MDSNKQRISYVGLLHNNSRFKHPLRQDFEVRHATATQLAEAFLRTIGKWTP
jgi:hypothetical protein